MKTKELIDTLKKICVLSDVPLSVTKDVLNETIKRLEELEELKCRLHGIKMCVEGEVKIKE